MRKQVRWQVLLSAGLIGLSALLYYVHFLIFKDAHHIFLYLIGDIAFIPVDVLLVTLILHQIITKHDKKVMLKKMNMVIGAFFSESGTQLLKLFSAFDKDDNSFKEGLVFDKNWQGKDFDRRIRQVKAHVFTLDLKRGDLAGLRAFLISNRPFLLGLLENPNLLEHEDFTGLLWAVFHLTEELSSRPAVSGLPASDLDHLRGDISRAYGNLIAQWFLYMKHLHKDYPYIFSLAMRTNPFDVNASVIVG
ncbi:MAG: hypothetical protein PHE65_04505 [Candidatus Omnitrophica bacterium]|nr:hypothetical protein [Candidatus Omnitrophota bacterium]